MAHKNRDPLHKNYKYLSNAPQYPNSSLSFNLLKKKPNDCKRLNVTSAHIAKVGFEAVKWS